MIRRMAAIAMGAALVLSAGACTDNKAAEAEAKAKADAEIKDRKLREKVQHNVECLSALKWQQAALTGAGIGAMTIYTSYYRGNIEKALGSEILAGDPPAPKLSAATIDDYAAWAYPEDVKKFTGGKDQNGDGKVSAFERSGVGFVKTTACVQEVAEMGQGPLAGKDKVGRMYRMKAIQAALKDKDA